MDLDIQVSKLKLMKANHTSQKYRLEDNIAKHYPQQITILKERISGMQTDIQTAKANLPVDKEQFSMKVGDKLYTDKKEGSLMNIDFKEELRKRDELLAGYLKQIEIQEEFIQKQKELIEYLEEHISKITDIVSGV